MVQKPIDSKFNEYGHGNSGKDVPPHDKQLQVSAKKTALRDLQNDNKVTAAICNGSSPLLKERGHSSDFTKVSGNKRPSPVCSVSPPHLHSPTSNAANGHLVYVRRKSEAEVGKNSGCESTGVNADYPNVKKFGQLDETVHLKSQVKELNNHTFPAFAPFSVVSPMNASGKPSIPRHLGKYSINLAAAESNCHSAPSAGPLVGIPTGRKSLQWEERYNQLQLLLNQLDQSDQQDYLQVLRSLSSVELSRHAVELEKRSIQLSLEEAKELQRVGVLDVLGNPVKNIKAPMIHQEGSEV